jgi:hypothetical protein
MVARRCQISFFEDRVITAIRRKQQALPQTLALALYQNEGLILLSHLADATSLIW